MAIKNTASKNDNEKAQVNRSQAGHRATWMALTFDEAKKAGADAEVITRKAIKRTGNIHGLEWKEKTGDVSDLRNFDKVFFNEVGKATFEIVSESTPDDVYAEFHYCPLLAAWQKLGYDDETCALLCDIAMDGDRGIAESMGYKLDLTDTIAKGCPTCKLHFHK